MHVSGVSVPWAPSSSSPKGKQEERRWCWASAQVLVESEAQREQEKGRLRSFARDSCFEGDYLVSACRALRRSCNHCFPCSWYSGYDAARVVRGADDRDCGCDFFAACPYSWALPHPTYVKEEEEEEAMETMEAWAQATQAVEAQAARDGDDCCCCCCRYRCCECHQQPRLSLARSLSSSSSWFLLCVPWVASEQGLLVVLCVPCTVQYDGAATLAQTQMAAAKVVGWLQQARMVLTDGASQKDDPMTHRRPISVAQPFDGIASFREPPLSNLARKDPFRRRQIRCCWAIHWHARGHR